MSNITQPAPPVNPIHATTEATEAAATHSTSRPDLPAPVGADARIDGVDVARGFALVGIFAVNIGAFAEPFGRMIDGGAPPGTPPLDAAAMIFTDTFCTGKFYGLFSLLFGIGFALQQTRLTRRGVGFGWLYLRRIFFLGALGLLHATLLWWGDILFIYSIAAVVLLLCKSFGPGILRVVGIALLAISVLLGVGFSALTYTARPSPTAVAASETAIADSTATPESGTPAEPTPATMPAATPAATPTKTSESSAAAPRAGSFDATPLGRLFAGMQKNQIQDPGDPRWMALETEAYRDGPYFVALAFRVFTWAMILVFTVVGFGWSIVGLFFVGASLARDNFLAPESGPRHRRLLILGLAVGLPLSIAGVVATQFERSLTTTLIHVCAQSIGAPFMSLAYLAGILMLVNSGRAGALTAMLASTGRMALTNYLTQTVIATAIFYHWGLGKFGSVSPAPQIAIVLAIYACQVVFSTFWLARFRFGPMEWLWRSFTYLKPQPLLRSVAPQP